MKNCRSLLFWGQWIVMVFYLCCPFQTSLAQQKRERTLLNKDWKFFKYTSEQDVDSLMYEVRPALTSEAEGKEADSRPTEAVVFQSENRGLKPWILPTGNPFLKETSNHHDRPAGNPGIDFPFVQMNYQDDDWEMLDLPHDWAIKGPFYKGEDVPIGGGMGRLPVHGVGWYRKKLSIPLSDEGKKIFLEFEGTMSYAMVWLNGYLVGGWPYGYNSWQVDLSPYIVHGEENQLAVRLDNPIASARWYPGAGIYRNVWLTKTSPVHIDQWGTRVTTKNVEKNMADVHMETTIQNEEKKVVGVYVETSVFYLEDGVRKSAEPIGLSKSETITIAPFARHLITTSIMVSDPKLWGPYPNQYPHLYMAVAKVFADGKLVDTYETVFGIRDIQLDPDRGLLINGEHIYIQGVNQHHDLGALGSAFNLRAAERQLEILRDMGCNAIRMAHNPPAPGLLDLTDKMGFLVVNEIYDSWERKKTPYDFHLIFPDWKEQDLRAMIRRDRNHPSVIMWSYGNEVGEQYTEQAGADLSNQLANIVKEEDPTRPSTISINYAKPDMPITATSEVIGLNYQGEGIRYSSAYAHLQGIKTPPLFPLFRERFPDRVIMSSENASALSSRGEYLFPVHSGNSAPIRDGLGGDPVTQQVSAYELYSANFGSSADVVFETLERHPYVAGGFAWTGWDYLGEPTPYYGARSSYSGIIDLAGFKKDRFYLYQSHWRPDHPMAHILPHWNWEGREGEVTPVHVFTSGDEAELFLNGRSLGRKKKAPFTYRLRWDDVKYESGILHVESYKNGERWASDSIKTTGKPFRIRATADRDTVYADGKDLSFITVEIMDKEGNVVPVANNLLRFSISGAGKFMATDNGNPADFTSFSSRERQAFNGLALLILRSMEDRIGDIQVRVESDGLEPAELTIKATDFL